MTSEDNAVADSPNAAQRDYWNESAGPNWVAFHDQLDRQIAGVGQAAIAALDPKPGERILDIGCGCGASTLALAERVGEAGAVSGVDLSAPMLAVARARPIPSGAARPSFRQADAQTDDLGEAYDGAFSRFGVMFFAEPPVAFANIRRALKPAGRLAFVCWRGPAENPFLTAPLQAAAPLLPPMEPPDPLAPGPFAFADPDRIRSILSRAGWTAIDIAPLDTPMGGQSVGRTLEMVHHIGPLGRVLRENPDCAPKVDVAVRELLTRHQTPAGVFMAAALWIVSARA